MPIEKVDVGLLVPNGKGGYSAQGDLATALMGGLRAADFRSNDVLQYDEWKAIDAKVVQIARQRLVGVSDLMNAGLSMNLANGLGSTVFQWEDVSDMTDAQITMDGINESQGDRVTFDVNTIPLPVISKDFFINLRVLSASRRNGDPLDTMQVATATRIVSDKIESILFNGASTYKMGSSTLYGYSDFTDVNTVSLSENWDASGKTGAEILADVLDMIAAANADHMYGPFMLYVPTAYGVVLDNDYASNYPKSIYTRLKEIASIIDIKVADVLTANTVLLVQMTSDTVEMIVGQQPTAISWPSHGGWRLNFKVFAIMVPRIASDHDTRCGIVKLS